MLIAFFFVAAYIGVADVGSRLIDPSPAPISALAASDAAKAPIAVASRSVAGAAAADPIAPASR